MFLVTMACANGLVALGLMLLLRAGLVSFGQALYFCLGAYAAGGIGRFFGVSDIFLQMLAGALTAGFFAFVLGFLLARYRGIFFGLLSLALSMILYGLLVKSQALGSTDGFNILPSTLFGIRPGPEWVRYCGARVCSSRCPGLGARRAPLPAHAARPARARRSRTTRSASNTWAPRPAARCTSST